MKVNTARVILAKTCNAPKSAVGGVQKGLARRAVNVILHYAQATFNDMELAVLVGRMLDGEEKKWPARDEVVRYIVTKSALARPLTDS